jgi:phosphoribosylanthranilate isomerase
MIDGIRIKVCGIISPADAEAADACGADYLGFILHDKSPRAVSLEQFRAMAEPLPAGRKVAVTVLPSPELLRACAQAGFEAFQVHFPLETAETVVADWASVVGRERLWLAPKLPPGRPFPEGLLAYARTVVCDTYAAGGFGGTGRTGDWTGYRAFREAHPEATWILAGGLSAANVGSALRATGARFIDVSSGVERSPGVKDAGKLRAFFAAVRRSG